MTQAEQLRLMGVIVRNVSSSEAYAVVAALALLFLVLLDNAWVMVAVSVVGLAGGLWVARGGTLKRAAMVAVAGFAVALVFGAFALLRR
jgi:hypothetical protein